MTAGWSVRLLGPVTVRYGDQPVEVGGPTARAVLAAITLAGPAGLRTSELMGTVWGGTGAVGRDSVYHYVKKLRTILPAQVLFTRRSRYGLDLADESVDWRQFLHLTAAAQATPDVDTAAARLEEALALWQGPPLADIGDRMRPDRDLMAGRRLAAIEELAGIAFDRGEPQRVHDLLAAEVTRRPDRERAAVLLIRALTSLGRREEAGWVYLRSREQLRDQLGLDPSEELTAAHRASLGQAPRHTGMTADPRPPDVPPSGLPRPDRHFTDRKEELDRIITTMTTAGDDPVCAVRGMPGIGKTALAARAAARLTGQFPDGCLFIDLMGHSDSDPLTPAEALDRLLRRLGVAGDQIPEHVEDRSALYRRTLADRRMLIVLDNARDVAQVSPLLPGAPGCGVIVTSRLRLTALDDATAVPLEVLPPDEATALFRAVAGDARLAGEPDTEMAVARIVRRCGLLPLAVRIAAAKHRHRPPRTLADLDAELAGAQIRLAALDDGERSVAASFTVSLQDLTPGLSRIFALLAMHPGADLDVHAAAALTATPVASAGRDLDALTDRHLMLEHTRGRYRLHDLIAVFAREYALPDVAAAERSAALRRLVDYYLRAAEAADSAITPGRHRVPLELADTTATLPALDGYRKAREWLDTEHDNLVAICLAAAANRLDPSCWQLAYTLRGYFFLTKRWQPWIATHEAAYEAARRCADTVAQGQTLNNLGLAYMEQGNLELATTHYQHALELFRLAGDEHGENTARSNLAWKRFAEQRYEEFLRDSEPVARFYERTGADRNAAITLRGAGMAEAELGRFTEAVTHLRHALDTFTRIGSPLDTVMTYNALGDTYRRSDDPDRAVAHYTRAVTAAEEYGSAFELARAHRHLGQLAADRGDLDSARRHWIGALAELRRLGAPQADEVAASLAALPAAIV